MVKQELLKVADVRAELALVAAEFTYRGHSYIWFHHPGGWDGNDGIVHNPDCKCSKK